MKNRQKKKITQSYHLLTKLESTLLASGLLKDI